MSESVCPKCGAGVRLTWHSDYNGTATDYLCGHTIYADGTKTQYGEDCLRHQLAQRDERIRELEDKVEELEAGDPQTHMHIGDVLDYWAKEQWHYIVCDADGWRTTEYIGKTAAEALAKIRKPRRKKIKEVMGDE